LVKFPNDILGVALNLEKDLVRILVFGEIKEVFVGMKVLRTTLVLNINVNLDVLGNVVNPLGKSLFSSKINHKVSSDLTFLPEMDGNFSKKVEVKAPGVIYRKKINEPLETGIKIIDSLVPIGRGQRELILGDRKTGKTSIAIDTILHQKNVLNPVICVYVAIGKRMSEVIRIYNLLKKFDCMKYTCIVVGGISDPASLQYLAPYSGCTIGEFFRDFGYDSLVIYDDLTKHADIYRQISLLLRRPVGREAYPGDVFYLHSRLLERSAKLSDDLGSGSLTALPIIETLQGDVSAYIPTNVISITDGQIYLDLVKHQMGVRPAVDPGLSVSRVGSAAQNKIMKKFAGSLKLQLAQFREVEGFSKLGSELDSVTKAILTKGKMYVNLLKQSVNKPCLMVKQIILLYLANYELIIDFTETELLMLEDYLDLMIAES
jgi:proton translocating ATP synthase F1 alpha subunit